GDYLSREEKLAIVKKFKSVDRGEIKWKTLKPNEHGDWLNQRNDVFDTYIPMAPEKKFDVKSESFFVVQGPGISSARDFWVYNFSLETLRKSVKQTITFYNAQAQDFKKQQSINSKLKAEDFIDTDLKKISWTVNLKKDVERGIEHKYNPEKMYVSNYRPFMKQTLYFDNSLIERPGVNRNLFPNGTDKNLIIALSGVGSSKDFSALISDKLTTYDLL